MGSLMVGWDSPVLMNPDSVKLEKKRSHTRKEIATFWKLRKKFNGGGCGDDDVLSPSSSSSDSPHHKKSTNVWRTNSAPPAEIKLGDWWTKSNWAFLNETLHEETDGHGHKCTASSDVTKTSTN